MQQPLYLADEAFDLLAVRVPNELLENSAIENFDQAIGMSREQFAAFMRAITADGRSSGWADPQTAATLRNALAVVILEHGSQEFRKRIGYEQEDATEMLRQLNVYLGRKDEAQS